jgi:hypothetical protein
MRAHESPLTEGSDADRCVPCSHDPRTDCEQHIFLPRQPLYDPVPEHLATYDENVAIRFGKRRGWRVRSAADSHGANGIDAIGQELVEAGLAQAQG